MSSLLSEACLAAVFGVHLDARQGMTDGTHDIVQFTRAATNLPFFFFWRKRIQKEEKKLRKSQPKTGAEAFWGRVGGHLRSLTRKIRKSKERQEREVPAEAHAKHTKKSHTRTRTEHTCCLPHPSLIILLTPSVPLRDRMNAVSPAGQSAHTLHFQYHTPCIPIEYKPPLSQRISHSRAFLFLYLFLCVVSHYLI